MPGEAALSRQQTPFNPIHPPSVDYTLTRTHTHSLVLSFPWSVIEATWQVARTLDVIGSGPESQPLEWWETVTCIVYLGHRGRERGREEWHGESERLHRSQVEYEATSCNSNFWRGDIILVKLIVTCIYTDETGENPQLFLLNHSKKFVGVASQIDAASFLVLSIDSTQGSHEITHWMCPPGNTLLCEWVTFNSL